LAFLVSLLWHLLLVFCVTVVILPANIKIAKPSTVSFLGPILEKTAFEIMLGQKSGRNEDGRKAVGDVNKALFDDSGAELSKLDRVRFGAGSAGSDKEALKVNNKELFGDFKFAPQFRSGISGAELKKEKLAFLTSGEGISIEGPLASQEISLKPEMPVIARRIDQDEELFTIRLKIKISKNGEVDNIALLASSGDPAVDLAVMNYVEKFRFAPLSQTAKTAADWGIMKIKVKSR
jgi:TonB family protein